MVGNLQRLGFGSRWVAAFVLSTVTAAAEFAPGQTWLTAPSPSDFDGIPALGDMNGDGRDDLVVYSSHTGYVRVAYSTGSGFQPLRTWTFQIPIPPEGTFFPFALANVRGDAADEFILFTHGAAAVPGAAQARVTFVVGPNRTRTEVMNGSLCAEDQTCAVGDIDGNGFADLVAFTQDFGLVWTSLSTGTSFGQNAIWHNFFCVRNEVCALGDVDGDGRDDILAFKRLAQGVEKGNVLVAPSTGVAFGAPRLGHGFFCIDAEQCLVGDANGDGRDDILLVKGIEHPQAEVLASISNGSTFINPDPFQVGRPERPSGTSGFTPFLIGDVTGDGRADLVQMGIVGVLQPGGGRTTVSRAYVIHQGTVAGAGAVDPDPDTPEPAGFQTLLVANCDPDRHELTYWVRNATTGQVDEDGPHEALYTDGNSCPDPTEEPFSFDFEPGNTYEFIAVDPEAIGCEGQNDPDVIGCQRYRNIYLGAANGRTAAVTIPPAFSTMSLQMLMAQIPQPAVRLGALADAGIDYSVTEAEIVDWLGNEFSAYIQFSSGLLALMEGRRLKRPVYIDVVFFDYGALGGLVALDVPEGNLDAEKVRSALLSAHNVRYGESVSDWTELVE